MRILLDKNIPYQIRRFLPSHEVRAAYEEGWSRLSNGDLLDAAERHGFDLMITADQNLSYQQNLAKRIIRAGGSRNQ